MGASPITTCPDAVSTETYAFLYINTIPSHTHTCAHTHTRARARTHTHTHTRRYPKFTSMAQPGDTIHIARYLVSGAESSSLFLEVRGGSMLYKLWVCLQVCGWVGAWQVRHITHLGAGCLSCHTTWCPVLSPSCISRCVMAGLALVFSWVFLHLQLITPLCRVQVTEVTEYDVVCVARNSAVLEGLLCVFHCERRCVCVCARARVCEQA